MASSLSGSKAFGSTHDLLMEGWEAKENKDGVVYFVNNELKITSWIHPYVSNVFEELAHYNDIKYAAYRTALKLRLLQLKLGLSWISVNSIKAVFSKIHVSEDCQSVEDCLSCGEAFNIIHNILEMSDSLRLHRNHLLSASEMILNLILELYDTNRSGKLACRSIRIALVALCSAKLSDKYRFFFNEISDSQGYIQREKFLYLIYDLMQITEILKESTAFGTNVSAAVNSCLNDSDQSSDGNSQDVFFTWLLHEPQTLIWLPTLHRVVATESIQHNVQCSVCDIHPIIGFRYRCMQCFNFDLCQSCFFHGRYSQGHRLKHPMQEYCFPTTAKDNTKALLKIMRNKISRKHRQTKIKFLPIDDDSITGSVFQWQPRSLIPLPRDSFCSSTDSGLAVGLGSGEFRVIGSHNEAVNDVVVGRGWSKSLEVLGDPCDTSSPCLQQEIMSKKNMDNQQLKMSEAIQQLQEENRILRQKLSSMRRQGTEDEEKYVTEEIVMVEVAEKSLSLDPLKEITTDEPISPIKSSSSDRQATTTSDSCLGDEKCELKNRNVSVNVLEIVGCCTPTPSSFCTDNKNSSDGNESGINEDEVNSDAMSVMSQKSAYKEEEVAIALLEEAISKHENQEPVKNLPVLTLQAFTDTETESTTSNDLEYTYSDMSLKSEMSSRAESMKKGQVIFSVERTADMMQDKRDMISTPQPIGTPDPSFTSVQTTPCTTKNDTLDLDLDAFRLCRMKFGAANESLKKLDRQNSDGSEPRLVYTSSLKGIDSRKCKSDSFQAPKQKSKDETIDFASHLQSSHLGSFELSEIPTQGSYASFAQGVKPLSCLPVNTCRTKTPEPVFMSTPVTNQMYFVPHGSTLKKRSASAKVSRKREEKENRTPLNRGDSSSYKDVQYSRKEPSTTLGMTPKSSLPPWQRQRILRSVDGLHSNRSYSCNDLTTGGEVGMTTLFDKAEHHRTVGAGSNSLALEDKEELERILEKVAIGNSQCSDSELPLDGDMVSNSSMLQAVMNVGDAMADFVHATAEVQMHKEESSNL